MLHHARNYDRAKSACDDRNKPKKKKVVCIIKLKALTPNVGRKFYWNDKTKLSSLH